MRLDEALVAGAAGRDVLRAGEVRDPPVAERDEVLDGHPRAGVVVGGGRGQAAVLHAAVDEHERDAGGRDLVEQLVVGARGGGDEAVDLARAHRLEVDALALRVVVGVGDQRRVAGLAEPVVDARG